MSSNCQSVFLQDWTLFYNLETNGLSLPCYSRKELSDLWDKCFFGPAQREEFTPAFDGMCDIIHCAATKLHCFLQPHSQASLLLVWDEYRRERAISWAVIGQVGYGQLEQVQTMEMT